MPKTILIIVKNIIIISINISISISIIIGLFIDLIWFSQNENRIACSGHCLHIVLSQYPISRSNQKITASLQTFSHQDQLSPKKSLYAYKIWLTKRFSERVCSHERILPSDSDPPVGPTSRQGTVCVVDQNN